ncbi:MAG: hypothetical protein ABWX94_00650 [Candidatus Saccharimonadales bacterium]
MSELIVLGLVPGTQIRITFILWALLMAGLVFAGLVWIGHRTHAFRDWLITVKLLMLTRHQPDLK